MPTYAIHLEVSTDQPLSQTQLDALDGGGWELLAKGRPRRRTLSVALTMTGGDVVGALARALNVVLDVVPGEVRAAEVVEQRPRPTAKPR